MNLKDRPRTPGFKRPKTGRGRNIKKVGISALERVVRAQRDIDPTLGDVHQNFDRPTSRNECRDAPRPCPWVSCRFHLYLDVDEETGSITFNFPLLEVHNMRESCALDFVDRHEGGVILEEVGLAINVTRQNVQQVEKDGLFLAGDDFEEDDVPDTSTDSMWDLVTLAESTSGQIDDDFDCIDLDL